MRLIDAAELYEKTAEWEAQALHMVEITMNDEDKTEWRKWSAILGERSAFKFDIADAPTVEAIPISFIEEMKTWAEENDSAEYVDYLTHLLERWAERKEE